MNPDDLNNYLEAYYKSQRILGAIMITAPWGVGKSYYIENNLIPFLKNNTDCKQFISISLYSIDSIEWLYREIIIQTLQYKLIKKPRKYSNQKQTKTIPGVGALLLKSIYSGISSHWNINFNYSLREYRKMLSLVDFSQSLVILEDVERTKIPIDTLLGFVNNLCEYNQVKVLLIANETELIKNKLKDTEYYYSTKEKSVYDTIEFSFGTTQSIESILEYYLNQNPSLNRYIDKGVGQEIFNIMDNPQIKCYNLRALMYAIHKTIDLFNSIRFDINRSFAQQTFLSIVAFSLKLKKYNLIWTSDENSPSKLGTEKYPLPKYCYSFLTKHNLDLDSIREANIAYNVQKEFQTKYNEIHPKLETIFSYTTSTENEVLEAIEFFHRNDYPFDIVPTMDLINLYNYFLSIEEHKIAVELIPQCKEKIKKRIKNIKNNYTQNYFGSIHLESEKAQNEWSSFKSYIKQVSEQDVKNRYQLSPDINSLYSIREAVNSGYYLSMHSFATYIGEIPFKNIIETCNSKQIDELRGIFLQVYGFDTISDYYINDLKHLHQLKTILEQSLDNNEFDAIKKLQINYFIENLKSIIERLDNKKN